MSTLNKAVKSRRHQPLPQSAWYILQIIGVIMAVGLCVILIVDPELGLFLTWRTAVPVLPFVFLVILGLWRNICPLATVNQVPRKLNFTRGRTSPGWLNKYGYILSISLLLLIVSSRKYLFNTNGQLLAALILVMIGVSFLTGILYKGKSGWCSSICPVLPVERIYGQTPFIEVANIHCEPCLVCTHNCYDKTPSSAYLADLYEPDRLWTISHKLFISLFPGFILAFYIISDPPVISVGQMYLQFALICLASAGIFLLLNSIGKISVGILAAIYGAIAINLYYWFNAPSLAQLFSDPASPWFIWGLRGLLLSLTIIWIVRSYRKEKIYLTITGSVAKNPT